MSNPEQRQMELPDYPFHGRYATVNGRQMHYLDEGPRQGEPLVMVHGNPSWSFFYRRLVLALRGDYRCIVPDHIGMGLSEKPPGSEYDYTLAERVTDLGQLLEQLDLRQRVSLVVHDWGGMIGMAWACRNRDRIERLVILNTAAFHLPAGLSLPWQLHLARTPLLGPLLVLGGNAFCRGAASRGSARGPLPPAVQNAYLLPHDSWRSRLAVLRFVEDIPLRPRDPSYDLVTEVDKGLAQFATTPMLICWGMRDFVFRGEFLAHWIQRFPTAQVARFANAGHYLLEDAGAEVATRVRDFLDRHPG